MKRLSGIVVTTTFLATGALAQQAPLTVGMRCSQASDLVANRGAIVLRTGQYTYDRYVRSQAFCLSTEFTRPSWVPTADTPNCFVGYTCVEQPPNIGWLSPHE